MFLCQIDEEFVNSFVRWGKKRDNTNKRNLSLLTKATSGSLRQIITFCCCLYSSTTTLCPSHETASEIAVVLKFMRSQLMKLHESFRWLILFLWRCKYCSFSQCRINALSFFKKQRLETKDGFWLWNRHWMRLVRDLLEMEIVQRTHTTNSSAQRGDDFSYQYFWRVMFWDG